MMTALECFELYTAVRLHFTTDRYDFFRYDGKTRVSQASLEKRNDRYFFVKFANKFDNREKLLEFFVANFIHSNSWIGNLDEEPYREWLKKKESLSYIFQNEVDALLLDLERKELRFNDLFRCEDRQHPLLLTQFFQGDICIETFIILNEILRFFPALDRGIHEDIVWVKTKRKCEKYVGFLPISDKIDKLKRYLAAQVKGQKIDV